MSHSDMLFNYVGKPDASFAWEETAEEKIDGGTLHQMRFVSQTWQGIAWEHSLDVVLLDNPKYDDKIFLVVGADYNNPSHFNETVQVYASLTGINCAFLYEIPNQPLFDGLIEDELIAHSCTQYLNTGDPDWPLLFPMVKSVVRAMDVCRELTVEAGQSPDFILNGASKRAWTSWLTAVVDDRVSAIIPQVFDNLNIPAQMPHQIEMWDDYSHMINDYTEERLQERMKTPEGRRLALSVDPYTYRDKLSLPKLLIHGSNDPYWATDAMNLYWNDMIGDKYALYVPNTGHSVADPIRVASTALAFIHSVCSGSPLPKLSWSFQESEHSLLLRIDFDTPVKSARLWTAHSANKDFRAITWEQSTLIDHNLKESHTFAAIARPGSGYTATFAEVEFKQGNLTYSLSTQIYILS